LNQDINQFIPSNLTLAKAKKGIFLHLTLLYYIGEIDNLKVLNFPLSEQGKKELELFILTIDDVATLMRDYHDESSDFIAQKIVEKYNIDYKSFYKLLNKFALCDSSCGDSFAEPFEYFVEFHDGTGNVIRTEVKKIENENDY
jgi:hypothetical protein